MKLRSWTLLGLAVLFALSPSCTRAKQAETVQSDFAAIERVLVEFSNDSLRRRAYFGAALNEPVVGAGVEIVRVREGSPAAQHGLRPADRVLKLNGKAFSDSLALGKFQNALRAGDVLRLEVKRGAGVFQREIKLPALPQESLPGVKTVYGSALSPGGYRVRTIITLPEKARGRLPAIFLAPWLSCDSVEMPFGPGGDGMSGLLHALATQSGYALMRVERPGLGDSEGPPCSEADFQSELDAYRAAFQTFRRMDFVDPDRLFILGLSNGGGYAPLVAGDEKVAGYVSIGGWVKTWLEHMLEHERRRLVLQGLTPGEVSRRMKGYAEFYADYLIGKQTPGEVIRKKPHLAELWYDLPGHQYGRPAAFYHQLQELNLLAAWEKVTAPVLAIWGEHDWIMSRDDHELIVRLANQRKPGNGRFVALPRTTHDLIQNETAEQSFSNFDTGALNPSVAKLILDWMKDVLAGALPSTVPASSEIKGSAAAGAAGEHADKLAIFGQFVGDWEFDMVQVGADGRQRTGKGEWHFGWILEGRAIQDVWLARFSDAKPGAPLDGHGTTIRLFDPGIDAWRVVWVSVARKDLQTFTARKIGDEIVLEAPIVEGSPERGRWIFSEITKNAFRWRAVESQDGGKTWQLMQRKTNYGTNQETTLHGGESRHRHCRSVERTVCTAP